MPTSSIEPGSQWWEASALTLNFNLITYCILLFVNHSVNGYHRVSPENAHSNVSQTLDALVQPDDIKETIGNLPTGKACGFDIIYYEHLTPIRDLVSPVLAYVYTWMLRRSFMPDRLKRDVIITLHKGGRKRKDDPNNYRSITLTSVLLKLYEILFCYIELKHPTRSFPRTSRMYNDFCVAWVHILHTTFKIVCVFLRWETSIWSCVALRNVV